MLFIFVTGSELLPSTSTFRYSLHLRQGQRRGFVMC